MRNRYLKTIQILLRSDDSEEMTAGSFHEVPRLPVVLVSDDDDRNAGICEAAYGVMGPIHNGTSQISDGSCAGNLPKAFRQRRTMSGQENRCSAQLLIAQQFY
jgi:hypothetical protein